MILMVLPSFTIESSFTLFKSITTVIVPVLSLKFTVLDICCGLIRDSLQSNVCVPIRLNLDVRNFKGNTKRHNTLIFNVFVVLNACMSGTWNICGRFFPLFNTITIIRQIDANVQTVNVLQAHCLDHRCIFYVKLAEITGIRSQPVIDTNVQSAITYAYIYIYRHLHTRCVFLIFSTKFFKQKFKKKQKVIVLIMQE